MLFSFGDSKNKQVNVQASPLSQCKLLINYLHISYQSYYHEAYIRLPKTLQLLLKSSFCFLGSSLVKVTSSSSSLFSESPANLIYCVIRVTRAVYRVRRSMNCKREMTQMLPLLLMNWVNSEWCPHYQLGFENKAHTYPTESSISGVRCLLLTSF